MAFPFELFCDIVDSTTYMRTLSGVVREVGDGGIEVMKEPRKLFTTYILPTSTSSRWSRKEK
jgi:hypothetical protein